MLPHQVSHALRLKVFEEVYDTLDNESLILLHGAKSISLNPALRSKRWERENVAMAVVREIVTYALF